MDNMSKLLLCAIRRCLGLTQDQVAKGTGISRSTIVSIENGGVVSKPNEITLFVYFQRRLTEYNEDNKEAVEDTFKLAFKKSEAYMLLNKTDGA